MVFFRESKRLDQKLKVCVNTGEGERRVVDCWKLFLFFFFVKCVSGRSSRLWFYFLLFHLKESGGPIDGAGKWIDLKPSTHT